MSIKAQKTNINLYTVIQVLILMSYCKMCFVSGHITHTWMRYILLWSQSPTASNSFVKGLGKGQNTFIKRQCLFQNCYVTRDKTYLDNIIDFNAILFLGSEISDKQRVPSVRSDEQKYVFVGVESALDKPVTEEFNSFFNWTWTYKLDSDIPLGHVVVRNNRSDIIGPKMNINWMKYTEMKPITKSLKQKLKTKKIAAIWFASNCITSSKREDFIDELQKELLQYKLELRKCGQCGEYTCLKENNDYCLSKVESDYYFYLAFENSLAEDFVTERVVNALKYHTVPIVYGGGNYSRFLPEGSYIDANQLTPDQLAKIMHAIISDKEKYYKFFRWHRYYRFYHIYDSPETDGYCIFCNMLNEHTRMNERSSYTHFVRWWNEPVDWSIEWFDGRFIPNPTTKYMLMNKKKRVMIQNPEALVPKPTTDKSKNTNDDFDSVLAKIFAYYFKS